MTRKILKYELKKIRPVMVIIPIIIFSIMLYDLDKSDRKKQDDEKTVIEYIDTLKGLEENETTEYMEKECRRLSEIISMRQKNEEDYSNGIISFEEFHDTNVMIRLATDRNVAATEMLEKCRFFDDQRVKGKKVDFFYDYNIGRFLVAYSGKEIFLLLFFIIMAFLLGTCDYLIKCGDMINTCCFGRKIFWLRLIIIEMAVILLSLLLFAFQTFLFYSKGYFEFKDMHICSMKDFSSLSAEMSVKGFWIMVSAKKLFRSLIVVAVVFFVTHRLLRKKC